MKQSSGLNRNDFFCSLNSITDAAAKGNGNAGAYEEIRVESSLNVRKTNQAVRRHVRSVVDILVPDHARVKRQFG